MISKGVYKAGAGRRTLTLALLLATVVIDGPPAVDDGGRDGASDKAGSAVKGQAALETFAVHQAGRIRLALSDASTFGGFFLPQDPPRDAAQWPGESGQNYVAGGGLWLGARSDSVDRVMHHFYTLGSQQSDWTAGDVGNVSDQIPVSDQDIYIVYSDSAAPVPLGITVSQTSRQWSSPGFNDFLIFEYQITNRSGRQIDNLFASMWLDPDLVLEVGTFVFDDLVNWDEQRNMIYASDGGVACNDPILNPENIFCPPGHIGLVVLSHPIGRRAGRRPHTAAVWNADRDPRRSIEDSDAEFLELMTGGVQTGTFDSTSITPDDYRMLLTAQPMSLAPDASETIAFGMAIGETLEALQANADAMLQMFEGTPLADDADEAASLPSGRRLGQNFPNPFADRTRIPFVLESPGVIRMAVYNLLGEEVAELASGTFAAGRHQVEWVAPDLPNGVYFYRLETGGRTRTMKMTVVR